MMFIGGFVSRPSPTRLGSKKVEMAVKRASTNTLRERRFHSYRCRETTGWVKYDFIVFKAATGISKKNLPLYLASLSPSNFSNEVFRFICDWKCNRGGS
eukprot:scaffold683_cov124-Cylindrotheca_fusiformis.AAC.3